MSNSNTIMSLWKFRRNVSDCKEVFLKRTKTHPAVRKLNSYDFRFFFSRAVFRAEPQLNQRLEEANMKISDRRSD